MSGTSAELSMGEVRQILDLVQNSDFESLELRLGDLQISVSKTGAINAPAQPIASSGPHESHTAEMGAASSETAGLPAASQASTSPVPNDPRQGEQVDGGLIEITAPIIGLFYKAPEPGAAPFVEIGARVDDDTTVGLIEVMKVFNGVKAGARGVVVKCLVEDGMLVEYGQPIFLVRPESG